MLPKDKICIPIIAKNIEDAKKQLRLAVKKAGFVELRLDYLKKTTSEDLKSLFKLAKGKARIIATNRSKKEGGHFNGTESERIKLLEKCIFSKPDFIDLELSTEKHLLKKTMEKAKKRKVHVIVSHHDFKKTPSFKKLVSIAAEEFKDGADIAKIACTCNSHDDANRLLKLLKLVSKKRKHMIAVGMGEHGRITRVYGPFFGSFLTFASLKKGKESASGQLTVEALKKEWKKIKTLS